MARRVLVTRPEPGASRTAGRLAALGHEPVVLPLTETQPLPVDPALSLDGVELVALTSAAAARHAGARLVARLAGLPCLAVGAATAAAARAAGFAFVQTGPGDAAGLARLAAGSGAARMAYLCGRVRRPEVENRLAEAGMSVLAIETYDTLAVESPATALNEAGLGTIDAVLLYSAAAAAAFRPLAARLRVRDAMLLCLSPRVAAALSGVEPSRIHVAPEPEEDALLSLL